MFNASAFSVTTRFSTSSAEDEMVALASEERVSVFCARRSTAMFRYSTSSVMDARVVLASEERVSVVCARCSTLVIREFMRSFPPKLSITCWNISALIMSMIAIG